MPYEIHPSGPAEVPECQAAAEKAFAELNHFLYHTLPLSPESKDLMIRVRVDAFQTSPQTRNFKAVDSETGAIIGFAKWAAFPDGLDITKTVEEVAEERLTPRIPELRREVARALWINMNRDTRRILGVKEEEYEEKESNQEVKRLQPHVHIQALFTHPDHQRKGVARALLRACFKEADELGLPTYLEATQDGKPLYLRLGFETVGVCEFEAEPFGGVGRHDITYMIKLPERALSSSSQ